MAPIGWSVSCPVMVVCFFFFACQFSWLYIDETDPDGHLAWVANQLQIAEDNGEKVCDGKGCGMQVHTQCAAHSLF